MVTVVEITPLQFKNILIFLYAATAGNTAKHNEILASARIFRDASKYCAKILEQIKKIYIKYNRRYSSFLIRTFLEQFYQFIMK